MPTGGDISFMTNLKICHVKPDGVNESHLDELRHICEEARKYFEDPAAPTDGPERQKELDAFYTRLKPGIVANIIRELQLLRMGKENIPKPKAFPHAPAKSSSDKFNEWIKKHERFK